MLRAVRVLAITIVVLMLSLGCTTRIRPPADPADPAAVFLLDHGRTPSLVISTEEGGMIRYAYGDWNWYALGRTNLLRGIAALFWPTQGTLGRAELAGPVSIENVRQRVVVEIEHLYPLYVERADVDHLRARLDQLYYENQATEVVNPAQGLHFVHHPRRYTYFWNSNHAVASWLGELGCEIHGPAFDSRWEVEYHP